MSKTKRALHPAQRCGADWFMFGGGFLILASLLTLGLATMASALDRDGPTIGDFVGMLGAGCTCLATARFMRVVVTCLVDLRQPPPSPDAAPPDVTA